MKNIFYYYKKFKISCKGAINFFGRIIPSLTYLFTGNKFYQPFQLTSKEYNRLVNEGKIINETKLQVEERCVHEHIEHRKNPLKNGKYTISIAPIFTPTPTS